MTGKRVDSKKCPLCGGPLFSGEATIPYILQGGTVVVVKNVPAEICGDCHEPFTAGKTTDQVMQMLRQLQGLRSEVSVVSYSEYELA